jgi:hypothetical protein
MSGSGPAGASQSFLGTLSDQWLISGGSTMSSSLQWLSSSAASLSSAALSQLSTVEPSAIPIDGTVRFALFAHSTPAPGLLWDPSSIVPTRDAYASVFGCKSPQQGLRLQRWPSPGIVYPSEASTFGAVEDRFLCGGTCAWAQSIPPLLREGAWPADGTRTTPASGAERDTDAACGVASLAMLFGGWKPGPRTVVESLAEARTMDEARARMAWAAQDLANRLGSFERDPQGHSQVEFASGVGVALTLCNAFSTRSLCFQDGLGDPLFVSVCLPEDTVPFAVAAGVSAAVQLARWRLISAEDLARTIHMLFPEQPPLSPSQAFDMAQGLYGAQAVSKPIHAATPVEALIGQFSQSSFSSLFDVAASDRTDLDRLIRALLRQSGLPRDLMEEAVSIWTRAALPSWQRALQPTEMLSTLLGRHDALSDNPECRTGATSIVACTCGRSRLRISHPCSSGLVALEGAPSHVVHVEPGPPSHPRHVPGASGSTLPRPPSHWWVPISADQAHWVGVDAHEVAVPPMASSDQAVLRAELMVLGRAPVRPGEAPPTVHPPLLPVTVEQHHLVDDDAVVAASRLWGFKRPYSSHTEAPAPRRRRSRRSEPEMMTSEPSRWFSDAVHKTSHGYTTVWSCSECGCELAHMPALFSRALALCNTKWGISHSDEDPETMETSLSRSIAGSEAPNPLAEEPSACPVILVPLRRMSLHQRLPGGEEPPRFPDVRIVPLPTAVLGSIPTPMSPHEPSFPSVRRAHIKELVASSTPDWAPLLSQSGPHLVCPSMVRALAVVMHCCSQLHAAEGIKAAVGAILASSSASPLQDGDDPVQDSSVWGIGAAARWVSSVLGSSAPPQVSPIALKARAKPSVRGKSPPPASRPRERSTKGGTGVSRLQATSMALLGEAAKAGVTQARPKPRKVWKQPATSRGGIAPRELERRMRGDSGGGESMEDLPEGDEEDQDAASSISSRGLTDERLPGEAALPQRERVAHRQSRPTHRASLGGASSRSSSLVTSLGVMAFAKAASRPGGRARSIASTSPTSSRLSMGGGGRKPSAKMPMGFVSPAVGGRAPRAPLTTPDDRSSVPVIGRWSQESSAQGRGRPSMGEVELDSGGLSLAERYERELQRYRESSQKVLEEQHEDLDDQLSDLAPPQHQWAVRGTLEMQLAVASDLSQRVNSVEDDVGTVVTESVMSYHAPSAMGASTARRIGMPRMAPLPVPHVPKPSRGLHSPLLHAEHHDVDAWDGSNSVGGTTWGGVTSASSVIRQDRADHEMLRRRHLLERATNSTSPPLGPTLDVVNEAVFGRSGRATPVGATMARDSVGDAIHDLRSDSAFRSRGLSRGVANGPYEMEASRLSAIVPPAPGVAPEAWWAAAALDRPSGGRKTRPDQDGLQHPSWSGRGGLDPESLASRKRGKGSHPPPVSNGQAPHVSPFDHRLAAPQPSPTSQVLTEPAARIGSGPTQRALVTPPRLSQQKALSQATLRAQQEEEMTYASGGRVSAAALVAPPLPPPEPRPAVPAHHPHRYTSESSRSRGTRGKLPPADPPLAVVPSLSRKPSSPSPTRESSESPPAVMNGSTAAVRPASRQQRLEHSARDDVSPNGLVDFDRPRDGPALHHA